MNLRDALDQALQERWARHRDGRWLAVPVSAEEWTWLIEERYPEAYRRGEADAVDRAFEALTTQRRRGIGARRHPRGDEGSGAHRPRITQAHTLSRILLSEIEGAPSDAFGLHAFRRTVLGNGFVHARRIRAWIRNQTAQQGRGTVTVGANGEVRANLLAYVDDDGVIFRVATRAGHPLDQLRLVSEAIAAFGGWHVAQVTTFVLTGVDPELEALHVEMRWKMPFAARSRIVLTIDPTCTPSEVARAYRQQRHAAFGRLRRLSEKHAQLAAFAVTHRGQPAALQMAAWNRTWSRYRYRQLGAFNRDCRLAVLRLTEFGEQIRGRWGR